MKALLFKASIDVTFDDISTYGSVSPSRHIDYVITSRWKAFRQLNGESAQTVSKRSFAFPIVHFAIDYLAPIKDIETLSVESYVESIQDEYLLVRFTVASSDGSQKYSSGSFKSACIDTTTGRNTKPTAEVIGYFFRET